MEERIPDKISSRLSQFFFNLNIKAIPKDGFFLFYVVELEKTWAVHNIKNANTSVVLKIFMVLGC